MSVSKGDNVQAQPTSESTAGQPDVFPKTSRAMNIGIFPSSTSVARQQPRNNGHVKTSQPLSPMASQVPNHPIQQQLARMPMNPTLQPPASFYNNSHTAAMVPSRVQFPSHMEGPMALNGLNQSAFGNVSPHHLNQQSLPFVGPAQAVSYAVQQSMPPAAGFPGFVQPLVPNGAAFGAIGQTPRSQHQNGGQIHMTPPGSPGMHRNVNKPNQVCFLYLTRGCLTPKPYIGICVT